ncbi:MULTISPECIES: polysaccharide deacetylase family protein [Caproicibacterium]|uniref:Polysaccharide deacetylase family protein n=1 Tax=Caproicibacterium argilliputei TaxID=3030016 RepID=A0AA97H1B3_9FIRM|nr:polysaccharide deacetylase family protein [Caproicibacterium argilliputei]WOC31470.1 polysaccharide deacetylase family protein [Caproicibacterium argilliputei]
MSSHKRMSARERRRQIHKRHAVIVLTCVVLVAALIGGTYGVTTLMLRQAEPAGASSTVSSRASAGSSGVSSAAASSEAAPSSTGDPTRAGEAFEVSKTNLTGYQAKYPNLYVKTKVGQWKNAEDKAVYLTFDDGPSNLTPKLLEVLKQYNVKATFFLTNQPEQKNDIHYIRDIYKAGSVCAVHSASHNYKKIYASVDAFLADFNEMYELIQKETDGHCAPFFRFPGGSNNPEMSASVRKGILQEMTRRGFFFYDWDIDSQDAMGAGASKIYENVISGIQRGGNIPLMHNSAVKKATLSEVGSIIQYGVQNGYTFKTLDGTLDPSMYSFSNSVFLPLLKDSPNFKLSDKHEARFASLLGISSVPTSSTVTSSN